MDRQLLAAYAAWMRPRPQPGLAQPAPRPVGCRLDADRADRRRQGRPTAERAVGIESAQRRSVRPSLLCFDACVSPMSHGLSQQRHAPCHGASATRPRTLLMLTSNHNQFCPPFPTFCHVFLVAGHVRALFGAAPLPRNASPYHPLLLPTSLPLSRPPSNSNVRRWLPHDATWRDARAPWRHFARASRRGVTRRAHA